MAGLSFFVPAFVWVETAKNGIWGAEASDGMICSQGWQWTDSIVPNRGKEARCMASTSVPDDNRIEERFQA